MITRYGISLQLLLVDKKITHPKDLFKIMDSAVKEKYPILVVAEGIEQEALAPLIRNKLRGVLKVAAIKAPAFGERKSHCLDDIAILTGGTISRFVLKCSVSSRVCTSELRLILSLLNVPFTRLIGTVIRDDMGLTLEKATKEVLGTASKVVITKNSTLIVTDGSTRKAVEERVSQIRGLVKVLLRPNKNIALMTFSSSHIFYLNTEKIIEKIQGKNLLYAK